jgi:hypothetical protein
MKLVELQRHLLALITGHAMACEDEEYVRLVQQSPHLITLHKIIALWRVYDLERACPLTVAFLKRQGMFDTQLQRFVQTSITSPFIEAIAMAFLDLLAHDSSLYLASLAQFERAVILVFFVYPSTAGGNMLSEHDMYERFNECYRVSETPWDTGISLNRLMHYYRS